MSKLIVLSNRVNLPSVDGHAAGGLAVALQDALQDMGGVWLGWNGEKIKSIDEQHFSVHQTEHVEFVTCPLTQQQYEDYYCGFSNNTLWPAMHNREDLIEFQHEEFRTYQKVNQHFATELSRIAQPEDIIWVHDYHFLSIAHHCRELGMKNRIGFFLHIPCAALDIWKGLNISEKLIQHLSEYNVIGLQTEQDQKKCVDVLQYYLGGLLTLDQILVLENREIKIQCYPIGVNPELIQQTALDAENEKTDTTFNFEQVGNHKTIISVDRIDYSKGLIERFNAFADFLKQHPEYHQLVTDLQVACPCRMDIPAYEDLFNQVQTTVEAINHQFSQGDWNPIHCTHDTIAHDQLMQIYRQSDICWVNSLRDGMNLVAKEFIAAQDPEHPGILILSKYAGSAEQMPEAIIVDPESPSSMVDALKKALVMSKSERIERYEYLIKGLKHFDITDWRNAFLNDLKNIAPAAITQSASSTRTVQHTRS